MTRLLIIYGTAQKNKIGKKFPKRLENTNSILWTVGLLVFPFVVFGILQNIYNGMAAFVISKKEKAIIYKIFIYCEAIS